MGIDNLDKDSNYLTQALAIDLEGPFGISNNLSTIRRLLVKALKFSIQD